MALQRYGVSYSLLGASFDELTNVQAINLNIGVQAQLDQIRSSTATIEARYPNGYASPITALKAGTFIRIYNYTDPSSAYVIWQGKISDVSVQYGFPYQSSVGNADFITITCEGYFAALGRMNGNNYAMGAATLPTQMTAASGETGVDIDYLPASDSRPGAATTVSGTWADWVAQTALSNNARMWDGPTNYSDDVTIISPFYFSGTDYNFSDTPSGSTQVYDQINFDSLADNFYTQVNVATESFGTSTVTKSGATVPYRTYQVNTLNASAGQATDFGNYLLGNYGEPRLAISSFSASAEQQTTFKLDSLVISDDFSNYPGKTITVTFRGTTYSCIIEGVSMTATPASQRFTFYVSGADLNAYLILGNTTRGKLDSNRLGY
jgi:hypothetical protein